MLRQVRHTHLFSGGTAATGTAVLILKCGHVRTLPSTAAMRDASWLDQKQYLICRLCAARYAELDKRHPRDAEEGQVKPMAKSNSTTAAKTSTDKTPKAPVVKETKTDRRVAQTYAFVKDPKKDDAPGENTLQGIVLSSIKSLGNAGIEAIVSRATKKLADITRQDHRVQCMVHLRRLEKLGVVKVARLEPDDLPAKPVAKAGPKATSKPTGGAKASSKAATPKAKTGQPKALKVKLVGSDTAEAAPANA